MTKIINLQPHAVIFPNGNRIEPSGEIARVQESLTPIDHEITEELGFPILVQKLANVEVSGIPFPERKNGVFYVVSLYVAQAMPDRHDLLIPVGQFRDESGRIVGCQGLALANGSGAN